MLRTVFCIVLFLSLVSCASNPSSFVPPSDYSIHPDILHDPRHRQLTPRVLLNHQAGFLKWPHVYEDGKLAFIDEPGNGNYNYAGIGFRIFAQFLEAKLEKPFPQIVREHVFDPIGMTWTTNSHDEASTMQHVVLPVDEQFQNVFHDVIAKFFPELEEHE